MERRHMVVHILRISRCDFDAGEEVPIAPLIEHTLTRSLFLCPNFDCFSANFPSRFDSYFYAALDSGFSD